MPFFDHLSMNTYNVIRGKLKFFMVNDTHLIVGYNREVRFSIMDNKFVENNASYRILPHLVC